MDSAEAIFRKMFAKDTFSQWLGIELESVKPGYCRLQMRIRKDMLNGFGIAHGAICYALADSTLAFASNAQGRKAVSIETSITHLLPLQEGQLITATAKEERLTHKIAWYSIRVENENVETVALFKGTVYRKSEEWVVDRQ